MKRFIKTLLHNLLLAFLAFIWLVPIVWLVVTSFSAYNGPNTNTFFPKEWSIAQYQKLLFSADRMLSGIFACADNDTPGANSSDAERSKQMACVFCLIGSPFSYRYEMAFGQLYYITLCLIVNIKRTYVSVALYSIIGVG